MAVQKPPRRMQYRTWCLTAIDAPDRPIIDGGALKLDADARRPVGVDSRTQAQSGTKSKTRRFTSSYGSSVTVNVLSATESHSGGVVRAVSRTL